MRLLRAPKKIIPLIPDADVKRLASYKTNVRPLRRVHALTLLLLDTGLRISEALTLERNRVDLERRCVSVMGKGSRERMVPLSNEGRKALFLWLSRSKGRYVFSTSAESRLTYRNAFRDMRQLCELAGLTRRVHPHLLRHAFAVNYVRCGGDVYRLSRILGHSNVATTSLYLRSMGFESLQEGHRSPLST